MTTANSDTNLSIFQLIPCRDSGNKEFGGRLLKENKMTPREASLAFVTFQQHDRRDVILVLQTINYSLLILYCGCVA